ncbi:MAG: FkbM family methyltransferase, partial [Candidatus Margulisiibacteriota bacterium]
MEDYNVADPSIPKLTRGQLEKMSMEERMVKINAELEKRMKGLISEGIYPKSIGWVIGKTIILSNVGREYGIRFNYVKDEDDRGFKNWLAIGVADFILKSGLLKSQRWARMIDKIIKLPRALFPRWVYVMDGLKLQMDDGDIPMRHILKDYTLLEVWEKETTRIVKENVKPGMVCLDIGASIGYFTLQFARLVGETGKVYSFEPTEMNFNYMCQNIYLNGFEKIAYPFKMAAWNKTELVRMPACSPKPVWANGVAVGEFLATQGIEKVDFIKVDVDGPEPEVL